MLLFIGVHSRIFIIARPFPILRDAHQTGLDGIHVNVFDLLIILFYGAERAIEKSRLPEFTFCAPTPIDTAHRTLLHGFHGQRNGTWMDRRTDGVPVVLKKNPGRQIKTVQCSRPVKRTRK